MLNYLKRIKVSIKIISAILIISLIGPNSLALAATKDSQSYLVTSVSDGDTIKVEIDGENVAIRLIGVDTPESVDPKKPVQCYAIEASDLTKKTLLDKNVILESDKSQGDKDKYGRLLRYVFLQDGTNFDEYLVSEGYAFEYTYKKPYKYQKKFKSAEKSAKSDSKGLWASCNVDPKTKKLVDDKKSDTKEISKSSDSTDKSHVFYVSKKAKSKYYCDTDSSWKKLSKSNLLKYDSEEKVKKDFPKMVINKPC